jgi:MFS family permease
MPFAPDLAVLALLSVLYGSGAGAATPTINAAVSETTAADRQGEVFGLLQSSRAFGFLVGPILGGALFDRMPAAPYLMAGAVLLVALAAVAGRDRAPQVPR